MDALLLVPFWWSPTWRGASLFLVFIVLATIQHFPTNPSHLHPPKPSSHLQCLWYEINPQMFSRATGGFCTSAAFPPKGGWGDQGREVTGSRSNPLGHAIKYPASGSDQSLYRPGEEYEICTTSPKNHRVLRVGRELKGHPSLPWAGTPLSTPGWTYSAPKYLQISDFLSQAWLLVVPFGRVLLQHLICNLVWDGVPLSRLAMVRG